MVKHIPLQSIVLISSLFLLLSLGGCVGYSSVSVGVGSHDYWGPYYRHRPSVNYQYRYHHHHHGSSIGRPHHHPPKGTPRRPRPQRNYRHR